MAEKADNFEPTAGELESPAAATLHRVAEMQRTQARHSDKIDKLCVAMYGDREGTRPGLIEQVRTNSNWIAGRTWLERTATGVLVALLITGAVVASKFVIGEQAKAKSPVRQETIHGG